MSKHSELKPGDRLSKFWSYFPLLKFHPSLKGTLTSIVVQDLKKIMRPNRVANLVYSFSPTSIVFTPLSFLNIVLSETLYSPPDCIDLKVSIDDQPLVFNFAGFDHDLFVHHVNFLSISNQNLTSSYSCVDLLRKLKPDSQFDFSWIKSSDPAMFEIKVLNFTTLAYKIVIHLKNEIFSTKSFDLHVESIIVTQKDFKYCGRIPSLHANGVEITFWDSSAEININNSNRLQTLNVPPLRLDESTWPMGSLPKGIFGSVPDMFRNSEIGLTALTSNLDVIDGYSFVFDRKYTAELTLINREVNLLPELFQETTDQYTCKSSIGHSAIRIAWGVLAPQVNVGSFLWGVTIKYLTDRFGIALATQPEFCYEFHSIYNTWTLYYKGTRQSFVSDIPMSSFFLKHILECNLRYDFDHFTAKKTCALDFASINMKYGHLEVHERWHDPLRMDIYTVDLDYRSGWLGGSLEWRKSDFGDTITFENRTKHRTEKEFNRVLLYTSDFRVKFQKNIRSKCDKAYNTNFCFH
jgi:hypothetical protein